MRMPATPVIGAILLAMAVPVSLPAPASGQAASAARDPDAMAALQRMAASLGRLQSFSVRADITRDQVLTTGQKLKSGGTVEIKAVRPNRFRMEIKSSARERTLFYDGRNLTLFSPRVGYYATVAAPPTIAETLRLASERLGIDTPLADLFAWGTDPAALASVQSAFRVGTETIGGNRCEHYAVRQPSADWQVWIRQGNSALPCKLVITTTDDPSQPEFTATYQWNPAGRFAASDFAFVPPRGGRKITFGALPTDGQ